MRSGAFNVLFLCTGNSARSILAESYLNHVGAGDFRGYSAGSFPKGAVHPLSLATLHAEGIPVGDARSKSWDEFARDGSPQMDLVITVCDNAAGEVCPFWPGAPLKAHWSFPDPAAFEGADAEKRAYFAQVFADIRRAVDQLAAFPVATMDAATLKRRVAEIGAH